MHNTKVSIPLGDGLKCSMRMHQSMHTYAKHFGCGLGLEISSKINPQNILSDRSTKIRTVENFRLYTVVTVKVTILNVVGGFTVDLLVKSRPPLSTLFSGLK